MAKLKYTCPECDLDIYFESDKHISKNYACPSCKTITLTLAGFCRDSRLEVIDLAHKIKTLEERIEKLSRYMGEDFDYKLYS